MDTSSSDVESVMSPSNPSSTPPSSPPAVKPSPRRPKNATMKKGATPKSTNTNTSTNSMNEDALVKEEEEARVANFEAEQKEAQKKRKYQRKKKAETKAEREAKARELDELLRKSAAFSDILTKKTQVLGRVGSSLDGKQLGEHDLEMARQPKCMVGGTMRDYQLEGLTWMFEICSQGMSGILADEMGLGKTVQTIALIALLREQEGYLGPHLIVAPLSTLSNWMDEFQKWVPSIPVVMFHGTKQDRDSIFRNQMQRNLKDGRPSLKFPVVCTSYEMVLREQASLSKINWEFIIIDEGHRMKNAEAKLFQQLRQFPSATRLLITGTPLQNNLKELWSLLHFLLPTIFTDWEAFESWFDFSGLEDERGTEEFIGDQMKHDLVKKIHMILQPLLLRRIKQDVAAYLPRKREYVLFAPMTKEQTDLYNVLSNKNIDTREYLENKAVEQITSRAASARSSRASSRSKSAPKTNGKEISLPVRASPAKKASTKEVDATPTNALSMMMGKRGRGRPPKQPVSEVTTPVRNGKRKQAPTSAKSETKSARSSRHSTPASTRNTRGQKYKEADSDEERMSDDEFEAKLAQEAEEEGESSEVSLSPEEMERVETLELASKFNNTSQTSRTHSY